MIIPLSPFAPENLVSRDGFDSSVPREKYSIIDMQAYFEDAKKIDLGFDTRFSRLTSWVS